MDSVITIRAFGDNFIYLYRYTGREALVVDPAEAGAVINVLEKEGLSLTKILITHHHFDHTAGVGQLQNRYNCQTITANTTVGDKEIEVIPTPGHTADSVCYYLRPAGDKAGIIWTGDTLFVGGCGRILGSDAKTMWSSLCKIAALPNDTVVYGGHDYIEENYEFALTILPNDETIKKRLEQFRQSGQPDSTIEQEKRTNIFLRSGEETVKRAVGMAGAPTWEVFAELRRRKDRF